MSNLSEFMSDLEARIAEQVQNYQPSGGSGETFTNEVDPTVPSWAKASKKPTYSASEVGAYNKAEIDSKLREKQNTIEFDEEPTDNSEKMVKSGGILSAIKKAIPSIFGIGKAGLVPATSPEDSGKFLKADGSWDIPEGQNKGSKKLYQGVCFSGSMETDKVVNYIPEDTIFHDGDILIVYFNYANNVDPQFQINGKNYWLDDTYDGKYLWESDSYWWFIYMEEDSIFSPMFSPKTITDPPYIPSVTKAIVNTASGTALKEMSAEKLGNGDLMLVSFPNGNTAKSPKLKTSNKEQGEDIYYNGMLMGTSNYSIPQNTICLITRKNQNSVEIIAQIQTELYDKVNALQNTLNDSVKYTSFLDCIAPTVEVLDALSSRYYSKGDVFVVENRYGERYLRRADEDITTNKWIDGRTSSETSLTTQLNEMWSRIIGLQEDTQEIMHKLYD